MIALAERVGTDAHSATDVLNREANAIKLLMLKSSARKDSWPCFRISTWALPSGVIDRTTGTGEGVLEHPVNRAARRPHRATANGSDSGGIVVSHAAANTALPISTPCGKLNSGFVQLRDSKDIRACRCYRRTAPPSRPTGPSSRHGGWRAVYLWRTGCGVQD